jgi:phage terminase large subunit-like protein
MTKVTRRTNLSRSTAGVQSKYVDEDGKTDAETYLEGVVGGTVTAGKKLVALASIMLDRIRNGYKQWHYDAWYATRPVEFIETFCCYPAGRKMGMAFELESYERAWVELIFGFVDKDGIREFQYAIIEVARKNGKTSLLAAIELYMLVSDGEGAPQIYNSAVTGNQASLGYGAALHMLRKSPKLKKWIREGAVKERDNQSGMICDATLGYICTLSGDSKSLDGLDIHFGVLDELAAWKTRGVYDLIKQSIGAREQPMIMAISTQGFVRDSIWDAELEYSNKWLNGDIEDDRFIAILYELDDRDEMYDELAWAKANPGLGTVKRLQYMRDQATKARNDPQFVPTYLTKDLNLPANQAAAFLTYEECVNEGTYKLDDGEQVYCIIGFDAADFIDLTAAKAIFMRKNDDHIYERSMYWIPETQVEINSNSQGQRDGVPYQAWAARDLIRIVPGNNVPRQVIVDWIQEIYNDGFIPFAIGYDPWHVEQPIQEQFRMYIGRDRVVPVRQGALTLSNPMKQIKSDLRDGKVIDNHNPVNEWCRMNVAAKTDINNNVQPVKVSDAKHRIDGFMAELDAYVVMMSMWDEYQELVQS